MKSYFTRMMTSQSSMLERFTADMSQRTAVQQLQLDAIESSSRSVLGMLDRLADKVRSLDERVPLLNLVRLRMFRL